MSHERSGDRLEVALEDPSERLGIECLGERHGLDDVDEDQRDEPAKLHRRAGERSLFEQQRVVLAQDCRLELAELGAGIDAELVDEGLTRSAIGGEGVGLPTGAVEGQHELGTRTLAERLCLDERLELRDELGVAAQREIGVDALLENDRAELLEAGYLVLRERLVEEVRERRPTPESERLAHRALGGDRIASCERGAPFLREPHKAVDVDVLRRRARARTRARGW